MGLPLFAQFGDYFGGVLNPILTFATVILLYFSIRIQDKELNEIRREQERNVKEYQERMKLDEIQYLRRELQDNVQAYLNNIDILLTTPTFKVRNGILSSITISANDLYKNTMFFGNKRVNKILSDIPEYMVKGQSEGLLLHTIKTNIANLTCTTCELIQLLDNPSLIRINYFRAKEKITDGHALGLFTEQETETLLTSLANASHRKNHF